MKDIMRRERHDPAMPLIEERERSITRLLILLIASQVALAAYAWSRGDRLMAALATVTVALVVFRLAVHLLG
jgi:hypothetical protein